MNTSEELKQIVKDKYGKIAEQDRALNAASCCGATDASESVMYVMADKYDELSGYNADADLGLGCGLPTVYAQIREGDTVIDLGSGAGNDCFVARHETGPTGKVIGIDFTEKMIEKARINAEKLGYNNVEFRYGDIEEMPVNDNVADVIVSNCVLNLVPNKKAVISEIYRVLKPGGHFSISDIVLEGDLPEALQKDAEMYAGCVAGAIQKSEYLGFIEKQSFTGIQIQKNKPISLPKDILDKYLNASELEAYLSGKTGIFSITVFAQKPGEKPLKTVVQTANACCEPGSGCC